MRTFSIDYFLGGAMLRLGLKTTAESKPSSIDYSLGCSSGSLALDQVLGTGGWSKSRLIELSGTHGSGKTTLALHSIATCQLSGGVAAFLDSEFSLHPPYAQSVGVDISELIYSQPPTLEQAFTTASELISSRAIDLLVFDSITALMPQTQRGSIFEDSRAYALEHSNLLAKGLAELRLLLQETGSTVIFTNQLRQVDYGNVGSITSSTGGKPVKNMMATRVRLTKGDSIIKNNQQIGHYCQMSVDKHKDGRSGGVVSIPMIHERGFALSYETLSAGLNQGVVKQLKNGFYADNGRFLGATGYQAKETLDKWPNLRLHINKELLNQFCKGSSI